MTKAFIILMLDCITCIYPYFYPIDVWFVGVPVYIICLVIHIVPILLLSEDTNSIWGQTP